MWHRILALETAVPLQNLLILSSVPNATSVMRARVDLYELKVPVAMSFCRKLKNSNTVDISGLNQSRDFSVQ